MSWSIWQILVILVIVLLLFGTKKLRNIGSDLGGAIKGFKKAMNIESNPTTTSSDPDSANKPDSKQDNNKQ